MPTFAVDTLHPRPQAPPFELAHELNTELSSRLTDTTVLPSQPRIKVRDTERLAAFLTSEFRSRDLERLAPHLWLMSMQSGTNISPLHRQKVKGRQIVITEDPKLHLVWAHDRIFIKPLPQYLLSHRFWTEYLLGDCSPLREQRAAICATALGYLRTYMYLIVHESDFQIAQDNGARLVPSSITWTQFSQFSANFADIKDYQVSERYQYGELRLTRLNFYAKIFLRKAAFQRMHSQYGAYFARFYGPILFVFALIACLLNAIQVVTAVEQTVASKQNFLQAISRWFGILSMIATVAVMLCFALLLLLKILSEWKRALADRYGTRLIAKANEGMA